MPVDGLAQQVVREVVGAVRAGHDDAVFLELAQRLKQRLDARVVGGGEQIVAHAAAERGEPGDERAARSDNRARRSPISASTCPESGSSPRTTARAISSASRGLPLLARAIGFGSASGAARRISSWTAASGSGPTGRSSTAPARRSASSMRRHAGLSVSSRGRDDTSNGTLPRRFRAV